MRVEVVDTGHGIPPQELLYVFERSFRGEQTRSHPLEMEASPGAGLGLAISRALVEAHGGAINVESAPGKGTRLRFTLRRA